MSIEKTIARAHRAAASSPRPARRRWRWPRRPSCARQGRKALKVSVGRQPWAAGNSPVTAVHDGQQDVRALRGATRATTSPSTTATIRRRAAGRGVRLRQSRLRHVGQHADRAPDRAEPADPDHHRRRRAFPLRARDAQGFADPQHRRPQGQDGRRAARRRSVQRAVADAALRARQSPIRRRSTSPSSTRRRRRRPRRFRAAWTRPMRDLSGVPQGATPRSAPSAS